MTSRIRRSPLLVIHRPEWQANLRRPLRLAAEWQFGTWIIVAVVGAIRGELLALPVGLGFSFLLFLFFSGWFDSRRINSPLLWWAAVLGMTLLAAFSLVMVVVDPPE